MRMFGTEVKDLCALAGGVEGVTTLGRIAKGSSD